MFVALIHKAVLVFLPALFSGCGPAICITVGLCGAKYVVRVQVPARVSNVRPTGI